MVAHLDYFSVFYLFLSTGSLLPIKKKGKVTKAKSNQRILNYPFYFKIENQEETIKKPTGYCSKK